MKVLREVLVLSRKLHGKSNPSYAQAPYSQHYLSEGTARSTGFLLLTMRAYAHELCEIM